MAAVNLNLLPIQVGILGCAEVAKKMARAISLAPNANLSAVGSRTPEKAKRFAAENGFPETVKTYGSYEAVLEDPNVDAVYVPLPTALHARWAVEAAEKKKHVLLEKPTAMLVGELDQILQACDSNEVQFMDGSLWMHHPRLHKMKELLSNPHLFGQLKSVHSIFTFLADSDYLESNIRVKPDLDGLGALGDIGWYCIRIILWAADYELPKTVTALPGAVLNKAGVILSCGASMLWEDGRLATMECSFLANLTMDATVLGTKGTLHVNDFNIPFDETSASFKFATEGKFLDLSTRWRPYPTEHMVETDLPQEALMIKEFATLVGSIRDSSSKPDKKWPTITRKTQLVMDAVKLSVENGCAPVNVVN